MILISALKRRVEIKFHAGRLRRTFGGRKRLPTCLESRRLESVVQTPDHLVFAYVRVSAFIDWITQQVDLPPPTTLPKCPPPSPPSSKLNIFHRGSSFCKNSPCEMCEGDCDSDYECEGSLVCHQQRESYEAAVGCRE
mmetsp:Transcript_9184/g.16627  ORF Transcript_9184/g.16627 Transcript_9184/m.16627 type:complete len:138 (-) Transcript_9184:529-942(-)